MKHIIKRFFFA
ncbi:hypothetical protein QYB82_002727 [Clostridium perfringens]|nr:hypothetical protein [Clostridium perfringens]